MKQGLHRGVNFAFPNEESMKRFIDLYGDLFIPYAEDYTKICDKTIFYTRPKHKSMEKGYIIDPYGNYEYLVRTNLTIENLEIILKCNCFDVMRIRWTFPHTIRVYVLK